MPIRDKNSQQTENVLQPDESQLQKYLTASILNDDRLNASPT